MTTEKKTTEKTTKKASSGTFDDLRKQNAELRKQNAGLTQKNHELKKTSDGTIKTLNAENDEIRDEMQNAFARIMFLKDHRKTLAKALRTINIAYSRLNLEHVIEFSSTLPSHRLTKELIAKIKPILDDTEE